MKVYTIDCEYACIRTLPRIGTPQALDNNWNILLMSRNKIFHKEFRCTKKAIATSKMLSNPVDGMQFNCEPDEPKYMIFRSRIIYLNKDLSLRVLVQVIIHEVSHLVDKILEQAGVENVDTEVRAYMNDYYCDKLFDMMSFATGKERPLLPDTKFREKRFLITNGYEDSKNK